MSVSRRAILTLYVCCSIALIVAGFHLALQVVPPDAIPQALFESDSPSRRWIISSVQPNSCRISSRLINWCASCSPLGLACTVSPPSPSR